ncbi:PocR ligand-binding domain-containing protein [Geomonas diazotrophica]|uniref:PocR ligand-binding domain-containing protein n=1 Tax=Geomonas diazotrophica TaxID=2843197 RepID=UPI002E2D7DFF|nr:PocR ligand-binding domain-containing protein [Geomonas diazotrophica]
MQFVTRRFFILLAACLFGMLSLQIRLAAATQQTVRVAAFNFYPGIFQAKDGSIQGFYVDTLAEIARREGWRIQYVYGDWAEGISRIKNGEVDLLTSVAWTSERTQFLDYGKVPLLTVWGELYVPRRANLNSIKDVEGKQIAVMKRDFNGASFRNMVEKFGINCRFVEYGNFEEIFQAVAAGRVDAGVVNNTFGAAKQYQYGLVSSGIIFNPFDIFLATGKGRNADLLATLDRYLTGWRGTEGSPYHKALDRWSHGDAASLHVVPGWLTPTLTGLILFLAAAGVFIVLLRLQVRKKTAELVKQAADRKMIEETLFFINECGARQRADELLYGINRYLANCLDVDYAFVAQLTPDGGSARTHGFYARSGGGSDITYRLAGTPCDNVMGKNVCVYPREVSALFPEDGILRDLAVQGYAAAPLWDAQGKGIGLLGIMSRSPLQNPALIETLLGIASSRMAQELEAMNHLEELNLKKFAMDNMKDAGYWISPDGRICEVNGAATAMLGYTEAEFRSMRIGDLRPGCDAERWRETWETLKERGSLQFEGTHLARDGRLVPVEVTANYFSYAGTEYDYAVVRDITERKRMEEALEHRLAVLTEPMVHIEAISMEDLFDLDELQAIQDAFAQASGVASIITDAAGRPVTRPSNFCSPCSDIVRKTERGLANCTRSSCYLGSASQDGLGMQPCLSAGLWDGCATISVGGHHVGNWLVGQVLDEDADLEKMAAYADEIGADPAAYREALSLVNRMSREKFRKVCEALYQIAGQLSRMAVQNVQQAQHISEKKRSEERLLEYLKVIECSRDLICVLDRDYRYRMANGAFLRYRNLTIEQVVGRTVLDVVGEEHFAQIKNHLDACLAGQSVRFEMEQAFPERGVRSVTVTYTPVEDQGGNTRIACVISDQTDKKHLEEQLRQSQKMEAIGHLAGGIAHDFNNILTVIVGYGNFLGLDGSLSTQQHEQVDQIIAAAERGSQLTRGLLTFSRKQVMNPRTLDLNALVGQVQKFLLRIIGEDVELQFNPAQEQVHVCADGSQLEQVLMNLATNARDAMPDGGTLTIQTCWQQVDEAYARSQGYGDPGRYACIIVSDSGNGMDRTTRDRIFEPFFSTKAVGKGTGLGMSIVYGIVKQHKGFINVYSEPGEGTTFKIYLPEAAAEAGALAGEPHLAAPVPGTETVLVAEDDASVRGLVESLLKKYGYRVVLAVDGGDCVQKFLEHRGRIDLVLMDVIMPGKNGREAFEEIRRIDPAAKVLYSSGYTADFMKKRGVFDESVDLIMKPVQPMALLHKVREVLDRNSD